MTEEPGGRQSTIGTACFVDFDNLYDGLLDAALDRAGDHKKALESSLNVLGRLRTRLREDGAQMVIGRAYSPFDEYPGSEAAHPLALLGYEPQFVIHHTKWNSADLQLSIDLVEILHTRPDIERFVILGGDQDFIPIARKVLEARRELLICAPASVTSGDLVDRIGAERFLDAASLIEPDAAHRVPAAPIVRPAVEEPEPPAPVAEISPQSPRTTGARILGTVKLPQMSTWTPLSDSEALSDARQRQCLELIFGLSERFRANNKPEEVWLSPFLKKEMAEHFPELTHPQRRTLVNLLKEQGKIRIEERESQTGPYPYSVILLNPDHPVIVALRAS
ncbi:MAG: NYN domain-containing protein [Planctomycetes bacterium]|nr:NYN domain-containing protein [Planctomycetota bacterium]